MHYSLFTAAALVASASVSLAAPSNIVGRSAFEIKQIAHGRVRKNGPLQMLKTYNKFAKAGAVAPNDVVQAAAAQQTGTVDADPQQFDQAYLSPVTLGDSEVVLDFDTGSSDLWVFSSETPGGDGHGQYDTSTGKELQGQTWEISYGDGSGAGGNVYADKVVVGGVTATSQAIEAATSISAQFQQEKDIDGLLGLAFSSINQVKPDQQTTFFDTVKPTLQKALFAVDLKAGAAGSYDFGFLDSSKYSGSITYVPVDSSQGFWAFNAGGFTSASGSNTTSGAIGQAIADTGTSLVYLPTDAVQSYYSGVNGAQYQQSQGGYTIPCSAKLPDFGISIGGKTFNIPGDYINYAPVSGDTCFGGLQPNTGIGFTIFGDVFLKSVYAIFDDSQGSPRLGFAAQSSSQQSS